MSVVNSTSTPRLTLDTYPKDVGEWTDTDGDGYGDNCDIFPADIDEWSDADGDGVGDNGDTYPADVSEWSDTDGDGVGNNGDAFPDDIAACLDTDGDGHPDEWNKGMTRQSSTTGLTRDHHPSDAERWKKEGETPGFGAIIVILSMLGASIIASVTREEH